MKQITIRGVPKEVERVVKREAARRKTSLNKAVVSLLEKAAGAGTKTNEQVLYHDLDHLAGLWAGEEAAEFDKTLATQRKIDEGMWKRTK
jgi:hypothetical protein